MRRRSSLPRTGVEQHHGRDADEPHVELGGVDAAGGDRHEHHCQGDVTRQDLFEAARQPPPGDQREQREADQGEGQADGLRPVHQHLDRSVLQAELDVSAQQGEHLVGQGSHGLDLQASCLLVGEEAQAALGEEGEGAEDDRDGHGERCNRVRELPSRHDGEHQCRPDLHREPQPGRDPGPDRACHHEDGEDGEQGGHHVEPDHHDRSDHDPGERPDPRPEPRRAGAATMGHKKQRHEQCVEHEDAQGEGPAVVERRRPRADEERRDPRRVLPRGVVGGEGALTERFEPALVDDQVVEHPRGEIDRYHRYDPGREPDEDEGGIRGPGGDVGTRQWGIHLMGFRVGCGEHSHEGTGARRSRAFPVDGCPRWIPCRRTHMGASAGRET